MDKNKVCIVEIEGLTSDGDYAEHMYTTIDLFWKMEDANEYAKTMIENAQKEQEHIVVSVYAKNIR